jgi:hypothetical protein
MCSIDQPLDLGGYNILWGDRSAALFLFLVSFLSERAPFRQARFAASRLAQNRRAWAAQNHSLRMRKHSRDGKAPLAFHIHEEAIRTLY